MKHRHFILITLLLLMYAGYSYYSLPHSFVAPDLPYATEPILPDRLLIPKIGVNAHVQQVGIGQTGNMAVPKNAEDVGWYRLGPKPGEQGSAVIDGHLDNGFGLAAVFNDLDKLEVGDEVYVVNASSTQLKFVVTDKKLYDLATADKEAVFGNNGAYRLNLITCEGVWDDTRNIYDQRLVIFTELVKP